MNTIVEIDRAIFLFLNHLGSEKYDYFWYLISDKFIWIPFYVILLLILIRSFNLKSFFMILIFIALGITISDQLAGIFKEVIARLRPLHEPLLHGMVREIVQGGAFSFYSAHASNSFFIASFLVLLLKKKYGFYPYFLFIWASVVAFSRIYLGVHYPLDILYGGLIGFLLGGLFATLTQKVIQRKEFQRKLL